MSSAPDLPSLALPGAELAFIRLDEAPPDAEVSRNDVLRFDASKMRRTPQGGLRGPAAVSRVGVFMYKHDTGPKAGQLVREFRPPEEVFAPESMATLDQAPITDGHPAQGNGLLNADNTTKFSKGQLTDVKHDETHVLSDAVIQDGALVKSVLSGARRDFSPGYVCKMDWTPGVWNGQPYDVVQRGIRYNHVAILPPNRGRQGSSVALRFDAAIITESPKMIVHLDGKSYDLADEAQRAAFDAAMKAKEDAGKAATDKVQAKADALEAELAPLKAAKVAEARKTLEASALKVLGEKGKDVKFDGKTDREVRETAIGVDCKGKSDEYVAARFDQMLETTPVVAPAEDTALVAARTAMLPVPGSGLGDKINVPVSWTNRWQEPLNASKDRK